MELAADVAVTAVRGSVRELASLHEVIFCCFSRADLLIYERLLGEPPSPATVAVPEG